MKKNRKTRNVENQKEISVFSFASSSVIEKIIYCFFLVVAGLHVAGIFMPSYYAWGFNYISFLHPALKIFFILFTIFIFLPSGQKIIFSIIRYIIDLKHKIPPAAGYLILIIFFTALFLILKVKINVLGDGSLMTQIASSDDVDAWTNREMLTTRLVSFLNNILKATGPDSITTSYVIISIISGIIFIISIIQIAKLLGKNENEKILIFLFLILSSSSLLFFGYVENYPVFYAFLSIYVLCALRCLLLKSSIMFAVISYAIVFLLHMGALALAPTLLFLFYIEIKRKRYMAVIINLVVLLVVFAVLLFMAGNGLEKLIKIFSRPLALISDNAVPMVSSYGDFSTYTMFSFWHFIDFINHQILINPLALALLLIFFIYLYKKIDWKEPVFLFLLSGSLLAFFMEFTINHIYGMGKDWDIMAPYVILFSLLFLFLLSNKTDFISGKNWIVSLLIGISFLHSIPYILVYAGETSAIERSISLQNGNIMPKIGIVITDMNIGEYFRDRKDFSRVKGIYESLISRFPQDSRGYLLLARMYDKDMNNIDKALEISAIGLNRGVPSKRLISNTGQYFYLKGNYDDAMKCWSSLMKLDSNYNQVFPNLGYLYALKGKYDSAIIYMEKAAMHDNANAGIYQNLGNCYLAMGNHTKSIQNYEKCITLAKTGPTIYKNLGLCYSALGDNINTRKYWSKYLEIAPKSAEYDLIKKKLDLLKEK
jgi:tetratricopeptide (TPR) repeat protein